LIENDGRVITKDADGNFMEFIIRIIEDMDDINGTFKFIEAEGGEYELIDEFLTEYVQASVDLATALSAVLQGTRIEIGEVEYMGEKPVSLKNMSVKQAVYELLNIFGAERRYRVDVKGNRITRRYLDALKRRGRNTGKRWEDGKDIISTNRIIDSTTVKTALYGRGASGENDSPRLTFADVEWSKANGDPADKPLGQTWVGDPNALIQWGYQQGTRHKFGFYDGQEEDPAELLLNTWNRLQEITKSNDTYDIKVLQLAEILDLRHETVRLGDTTYAVNRRIYPAVEAETSVIEYRHNLNDRKLSEVTLGKFRARYDLSERFDNVEQVVNDRQGNWDKKPTKQDLLSEAQKAIDEAQERIDAAKEELEQSKIDLEDAENLIQDTIDNPQDYSGNFEGVVAMDSAVLRGTLTAQNATITGTLLGANATFVDLTVEDITAIGGSFQDVTITGTLNSVDGTFVGDLVGARITSNSTIDVTTDLRVGDQIHVGQEGTSRQRGLFFGTTTANGGVFVEPGDSNVYVSAGGSGDVVLDTVYAYIGSDHFNNRIVTRGYLEDNQYYHSGDSPSFYDTSTTYLSLGGAFRYSGGYFEAPNGSLTISQNRVAANIIEQLSSNQYKKNIELWEENATDMIASTPIKQYQYNNELDDEFPHVGIIVEEAPAWVVGLTGEGVEPYKMAALAWKAIQELENRLKAVENRED
ncbi:phage minor structural protein, N-terminal region, partial [Oceanobacillus limi]